MHRIDDPVAESSAVSLYDLFREHYHKPAPAAGCAGERKGKAVTICMISTQNPAEGW